MLGYVKNLKTTSAQEKPYKKDDTIRMYHKQLISILRSLQSCKDQLKNISLPIGKNNNQKFDITCPILYIISDTEGADKICGRYGSHQLEVKRHCRMCDVNGENLDNEKYKYTYLKQSEMHHIAMHGTDEQQRLYSQHKLLNAFHNINFGGQKYGLLGCTRPNILHVIRKGIVEWSVKTVLENLTDTKKALLDDLAIAFCQTHRQKYRNIFPKTSFPNGFTNLSNLQAHEWVGVLYLLVILSQTVHG